MPLDDRADRLLVLSRIRWLVALASLLYAVVLLSLQLTPLLTIQLPASVFLTLLPLFFVLYNSGVVTLTRRERYRAAAALGLAGDLLAVTAALYGTGGLSSWVWSLYPLVTIEAAFLTENMRWTVAVAIAGPLLYALMLEAEYLHWLLAVHTPVTTAEATLPPSYRVLKWSWLALMNGAAAVGGLLALRQLAAMRSSLESAYQRLDAQYAQLRELDRMKSTFLSVVSHELRTPLAVLQGYTELLEDDRGLSPEGRAYLAQAISSAEALSEKVNMVIAYSALANGSEALRREPASASEILAATAEACRQPCQAAQVVLMVHAPPELVVELDASQLTRALIQLTQNARQATPAGGTIGLEARAEGDSVVFTVWDTGCGMPAHIRTRIGEPFLQASDKLSEHTPGFGLGLAYAELVARLHGGRLAVADRPGGGTIVSLSVPGAVRPGQNREELRMSPEPSGA